MKRFLLFFMAAVLFVFFMAPVGVAADNKSKIHIKFSTWHPPASREVKTVWEPMLRELNKRSNGRITYTLYSGGALGKGPEHYDIVAKGMSDMGYFTATWTPGRFPLTDVLSLATWVEGKDIAVDIGNEMYKEGLNKEFPGVKVIELNGCIQSFLWTKKKQIKTIEDCKGLKIRTPGGHQTKYIKALGAEPVFMPLGDVYLALETGTLDGVVTCPPSVLAFKLQEVLKYGVAATFGCVSEGVIMNQKSWDNTPDDLKKIIEEVCSNPFRTTGGLTREAQKPMIDTIVAAGVNITPLSKDQEAVWYGAFQKQTKNWVAELEAKGLPVRDILTKYNRVTKEHGIKCVAFPEDWK
jgi:TRAP-type C4-dicarboxylate transport system substrate-binding protein